MKSEVFAVALFWGIISGVFADDAENIVAKADSLRRGNTSFISMTMTIVRPSWSRTIKLKMWDKRPDEAMVYIEEPAKEKGQTFLKKKTEMWNWLPSISRLVKIPASMMSQSWMGSDYTNDDLMKESSLIHDYTHKIIGIDTVGGRSCYKIESVPKSDAAVVWGRLLMWITDDTYCIAKIERYDEDGELVNTEISNNFKMAGNREVSTHLEIIPQETGNKTLIDISQIDFDKPFAENFFSQQNMKRIH